MFSSDNPQVITTKQGDLIIVQQGDANVVLQKGDRFDHMLVLGPTGPNRADKTLLSFICQDFGSPDWGVIVLDPYGKIAHEAHQAALDQGRRAVLFDPTQKNSPKFNPLSGDEEYVLQSMTTALRAMRTEQYHGPIDSIDEMLLQYAVKVLKRMDANEGTDGKYATLIRLSQLLQNFGGQGRDLVNAFYEISAPTDFEAKENADIASWFLCEYFVEHSDAYSKTTGIRSLIVNLVSNKYLRNALCPDYDKGEHNELDFGAGMENGTGIFVAIPRYMLGDSAGFLAHLIMASIKTAAARRVSRPTFSYPYSLYLLGFHSYAAPEFTDDLDMYRDAGISLIIQGRSLGLLREKTSVGFVQELCAAIPNVILQPGLCVEDAECFAKLFAQPSVEGPMAAENLLNGWNGDYFDIAYRLSRSKRLGKASDNRNS